MRSRACERERETEGESEGEDGEFRQSIYIPMLKEAFILRNICLFFNEISFLVNVLKPTLLQRSVSTHLFPPNALWC